jgi:hypothetical protein
MCKIIVGSSLAVVGAEFELSACHTVRDVTHEMAKVDEYSCHVLLELPSLLGTEGAHFLVCCSLLDLVVAPVLRL